MQEQLQHTLIHILYIAKADKLIIKKYESHFGNYGENCLLKLTCKVLYAEDGICQTFSKT